MRLEDDHEPDERAMMMGLVLEPMSPDVVVREIVPDAPEVRMPVVVVMSLWASRIIKPALIEFAPSKIEPLPAVVSVALIMRVAFGRDLSEVRNMFPTVCSSDRVPDDKVCMVALVRPVPDDLR